MTEYECKHYHREEVDIYLVLSRERRKFIKCKCCGVWLEESKEGASQEK